MGKKQAPRNEMMATQPMGTDAKEIELGSKLAGFAVAEVQHLLILELSALQDSTQTTA